MELCITEILVQGLQPLQPKEPFCSEERLIKTHLATWPFKKKKDNSLGKYLL